MPRLIVLATLALLQTAGRATLSGTIEDDESRPVEGVLVVVSARDARPEAVPPSGKSDRDGRFEIALDGKGPFAVDAYVDIGITPVDGRKTRGLFAMTGPDGRGRLVVPRGNVLIKASASKREVTAAVTVSENQTARVEIVLPAEQKR